MPKPSRSADAQPLWRPSPAAMKKTAMFGFMQQAVARHGIADNYDALYQWSIDEREAFWSAVWDFTEIKSSRRWDTVLENGDAMPGASWFGGSRLNFTENLLRYRDQQPAIIFRGENGDSLEAAKELTYRQLHAEVVRVSHWLKSLGVKAGDRVVGYMSNGPEVVIAMLATAGIGAIWSSCSPDFGVKGVLERFAQINPRVLFAIDGYRYNGQSFDVLESVATVVAGLDSIEHVIIAPFLNSSPDLLRYPTPCCLMNSQPRKRKWNGRNCPSTIRCIFCIHRAPPARPSASSTASAARSFSTSKNTDSTLTSTGATNFFTSPPAAG